MMQPYTLGFNTTVIDGGNIVTNTVRAQSLYAGSVEAFKISTQHLAAGSITTSLLAVGPQYQFRCTSGGQQMTMNQDGSLSLPNINLNPIESRWVMDATRSYSASQLVKTFAATATSAGVSWGIICNINQATAFTAAGSNGIMLWLANGYLNLYRVTGVGVWTNIGSWACPLTGVDRLVVHYYGAQGTPRMRVFFNGTEIAPGLLTDALLGSSGGAQGGCAGFLLNDQSIKLSEIVMGNQTVIVEDGRIQAQHLDAVSIGASQVVITSLVGGINAGSTTINGGKITTNSIVADQIQVATINAAAAWVGALDAKILTARTIKADKIEARAMNLINNFTATGTVVNWGSPGPLEQINRDGNSIRAMKMQTNGNISSSSDTFEVDASKNYTFKLSALTGPEAAGGNLYYGVSFYDKDGANVGGYPLLGSPGSYYWGALDTNPYFVITSAADGSGGKWLDLTGVVMAADTPANLAAPRPTSDNDPYFLVNGSAAAGSPGGYRVYKMPPNCVRMEMRFLNFYNSGTTRTIWFHNPAIIGMGNGQISADMIRAGSLLSSGDGTTGAYSTAVVVNDATASIAYTAPVGYRISNSPFSVKLRPALNKDLHATYLTSRTVSVQAEFGTGVSLGGFLVGELTSRTLNALDAPPLDAPGSTTGPWYLNTARVFYRGNNDTAVRGGAPNGACLQVYGVSCATNSGVFETAQWMFNITPTSYNAASDNLDSLRFMRVRLYAATTSTAPFADFKVPITDRLYDGGTGATGGSFAWAWRSGQAVPGLGLANAPMNESNNQHGGYMRCTLYNAYGPSADIDFGPNTTTGGGILPATAITGQTGDTGGGTGGGGGGCLPAGSLFHTFYNGQVVRRPIETIQVGDWAVGYDDATLNPVVSRILQVFTYEDRELYRVTTTASDLICSHDHRLALVSDCGELSYPPARDLKPGDRIYRVNTGTALPEIVTVQSSLPTGERATVHHVQMESGHVYVGADYLAHNLKNLLYV